MSEAPHKLVLMVLPADVDVKKLVWNHGGAGFETLPYTEVATSLGALRSSLSAFNFEVEAVAAGMRQLLHGKP